MDNNTPQWLQLHRADELLRKKRQGVIPWDEGEQERVRAADESAAVLEAQRLVELAEKAALEPPTSLDGKVLKRPQGRPSRGRGIRQMTGIANIENTLQTKRIVELRSQGMTQEEIGAEVGLHQSTIARILKTFVDDIALESAEHWRAFQLRKLQKLEQIAAEKLTKFVPVIQSGAMVSIPLLDNDGQMILDPSGKPIPVPAQNDSVTFDAINALLKINAQTNLLMGLNLPVTQSVKVAQETPQDITFRVIDAVQGKTYSVEPQPAEDPQADDRQPSVWED